MNDPALMAVSPLDGRYRKQVAALSEYASEFALIRYRVLVEIEYFVALLGTVNGDLSRFDPGAFAALKAIYESFSLEDAAAVKAIERETNHDVKAVEYFIKARVRALPSLADQVELVHMGLTSEDVNNLAYSLMLRDAVHDVLLPAVAEVIQGIRDLASSTKGLAMLARTHGQPASPTTLGKELGVFLHRLGPEVEALHRLRLTGKLNGATGTFGALAVAYPQIEWPAFSEAFVEGLGLVPNLITTQIEPHDRLAGASDALRRVGHILIDFSQDMWRYVSDGYFTQRTVAGEVGSSAMPHKVNPIDFENAEGNMGLANALYAFFGEKLTKSRLQRDLSDSTVLRNLGVALGHTLMGLSSLKKGLRKVAPDAGRIASDLDAHPEVLAEAYQAVLRAVGFDQPYERMKALTRGQDVTLEHMRAFVRGLGLPAETEARLLALTPATYIGHAERLAELAVREADALLLHLRRGAPV